MQSLWFLLICLINFNDLLSLVLVTVHVFTIYISESNSVPSIYPLFIKFEYDGNYSDFDNSVLFIKLSFITLDS